MTIARKLAWLLPVATVTAVAAAVALPDRTAPARVAARAQSSPAAATGVEAFYLHGGGWTRGSPASGRRLEPYFERRKFSFESVDYPMPPKVTLAQSVSSIVDFINRSGSDAKAITLVGHSAGAELATAVAFDPSLRVPVRCLILLDGVGYDLPALLRRQPGWQQRLQLSPDKARAISPLERMKASAKRFAIFIGASPQHAPDAGDFARALEPKHAVTYKTFDIRHIDFIRSFDAPQDTVAPSIDKFLSANRNCR